MKDKTDAELIEIINSSPLDIKIPYPLRIAATIELRKREKKDVKKIRRMTLAILILTVILVILTLLLVFLTKKAISPIKSEVLQSNQIYEKFNDKSYTYPYTAKKN